MPALFSIIVTTYDRADALDAVLRSLSRQTDRNFEVVIADDGSGPETAALIGQWKQRLRAPLKQVWHEHRDFRAGEIRNRGIRASAGNYCIFLDGDCIARPDFVARHRALAEPGWFVTGNRVLLTEPLTAKVLAESLEPEHWSTRDWLGQRFSGGLNRLAPVLNLLATAYGIGAPTPEHPNALAAPQATLMASVAKGLFGGELPWTMIAIGAGIGARAA